MSDEPIRSRPVIVVHLDTEEGSGLTACTGAPFSPDNGEAWPNVPRVPCTGCTLAARWPPAGRRKACRESTTPPVVTRPPSGLALTGTPVAAVAGAGAARVLGGAARVAWLWRRNPGE